jgi:dienelactone hydrolase
LVLLAAAAGGLVHEDTVLALYLASHGYVVAAPDAGRAGSAPSLAAALASLDALEGVDSLRIAVVGRGPAVAAARAAARGPRVGALIELDPPENSSDAEASAASQLPVLVVLRASAGVAPAADAHRVTIRTPPGAERRRLIPAMTHLFLSSALRGWGDPLPAMAERLRRLGL